jgi:hypothetical protein
MFTSGKELSGSWGRGLRQESSRVKNSETYLSEFIRILGASTNCLHLFLLTRLVDQGLFPSSNCILEEDGPLLIFRFAFAFVIQSIEVMIT